MKINVAGKMMDVDIPDRITLPDLSGDPDERNPLTEVLETATDCWDGGLDSIYRWTLADGHYLYLYASQGGVESASITKDDIDAYLRDCNSGDVDTAQWLAGWGLDGLDELTEVEDDDGYDGPCRIWREPHYQAGHINAPVGAYHLNCDNEDGGNSDIWEGTRAEAQAILDEYYHGKTCYDGISPSQILSHGQYAGDTLTIVVAG